MCLSKLVDITYVGLMRKRCIKAELLNQKLLCLKVEFPSIAIPEFNSFLFSAMDRSFHLVRYAKENTVEVYHPIERLEANVCGQIGFKSQHL